MDLGLQLLSSRLGGTLSSAVGWAAARRWPRPLLRRAISIYSSAYGVALDEAALGPEDCRTFMEFFTRPLKPGLRPLDPDPDTLISPVDGHLAAAGRLDPDRLLQAKGLTYSMEQLVGSRDWAARWSGGTYLNFYLHPADYHRFHAPLDLRVAEAVHIPGKLLPVNDWSRRQVPGLYPGNERIVARAHVTGGEILLVFVAATSVGRVRLVFDSITTHDGTRSPERRVLDPPVGIARGEEVGRFELGSTVIALLQPGVAELDSDIEGKAVRLGQRLGRLLRRGSLAEDVGIEPTTP